MPRAAGEGRSTTSSAAARPSRVAPCAGADHSMLSISGMVPNGVPAVFLTAPDGTAVRADVKDNGYEFLLPNQRSYEQRYVVWTGGDGTPHVQPIVTFAAVRASACKSSAKLTQSVARVSPDGLVPCVAAADRRQVPRSGAAPSDRARCACAARPRPWSTSRAARALGPFAPGVVVAGRPGPVATGRRPARPPGPGAAGPAAPVPAPATPAPAPRRKHR